LKHPHFRNLSLALGLVFLCCSLGCNCLRVKNIFYTPAPGTLLINNSPGTPVAVVEDFRDLRSGKDSDSGLFMLWLVPYSSYEYPQFYREKPKEGLDPSDPDCPTWPTLAQQYSKMVMRHLTRRGLFRFVNDDPRLNASDALFRITGTIQKTSAEGHYSVYGLGFIPGIFPGSCNYILPLPYADGRYVVDVTLECKDIAGNTVATHRITGTTSRWFGAGLFLDMPGPTLVWDEPYARLEPLRKFLQPEIEAFAREIRDALAEKDAAYWESLDAARRALQAQKSSVQPQAAGENQPI